MTQKRMGIYGLADGVFHHDCCANVIPDDWPGACGVIEIAGDLDITAHKVDLTQTPPVVVAHTPVVDLDLVRTEEKDKIRAKMLKLQSRALTDGALQSLKYIRKDREAEKFTAAGRPQNPDPLDYPWAAGEGTTLGVPLRIMLITYVDKISPWDAFGIALNNIHQGGDQAIDNAETLPEILAVYPSITWPEVPQ